MVGVIAAQWDEQQLSIADIFLAITDAEYGCLSLTGLYLPAVWCGERRLLN
jgi:hypothetical protein